MKTIIVEDEYPNARRLQTMLKEIDDQIELLEILESVESARRYISSCPQIDLIFLDIQLSDGLGLEILEHIDKSIPIIFTTAYDQYALETFKYLSVDYLLKPIKATDLKASLDKYHQFFKRPGKLDFPLDQLKTLLTHNDYPSSYICKIGKNQYPIPCQQIAYFFFEERDTWVKTMEGKEYTLAKTLEQLEKELNPKIFFRANRKIICSKEAILRFKILDKSKINLSLKQAAPFQVIISSEKSAAFKRWIAQN